MAKKAKAPATPAIADWQVADTTLRGLAECRQALARIEAAAVAAVDRVKADAKAKAAPYVAREKAALVALEEFTKANQDALDGRSKTLTHGRLGFRKTTKLTLKRKVEFVLQALRAKDMRDCIRTKEEINKEALSAYDDDTLKAVGVAKKATDVFFAETGEVTL